MFRETLGAPTVTLSLANYDNNQHAEDENLKLVNLWEAIAIAAAVMESKSKKSPFGRQCPFFTHCGRSRSKPDIRNDAAAVQSDCRSIVFLCFWRSS